MPHGVFLDADEIYREGRRKGHSILLTTNYLIAAIAIDNGVPMWHRDRDYAAIVKFTPLRISR